MKKSFDKILILLIIKIIYIYCNYDIYRDQFSVYFNRAFNTYNNEKELNDESVNYLLYNNIFSTVKIGKSQELIYLFLTFNHSNISIISSNYLNSISYNKELSTNDTILKKDIIQFPKTDISLDFQFFLNLKENDLSGNISYLGLGLKNENNKNSFISQLKQNNIIKNRRFSILYKENSISDVSEFEGQILFGLLPHEMTSRYNEKELFWTSIIDKNDNINDLKWKIKFDGIYYNEEKESINIKEAEFDLSLNLIIGPEEFRQKIVKNYFERFISEKLCEEEIFYNKKDNQFYLAYSCNQDYDIEDFPTLSFYNKELNGSFIMNYNQLLCIYKGKVYLKIVFKKNPENKKWILGRAFMEVFPLIFDVDNKKIGYYKIKFSENHPIFLFIFFIFAIIIFGYFFLKGLQYQKKQNMELIKKKKDDNYQGDNKEKKQNKNISQTNNNKEIKNIDEKTYLKNGDGK